jgi:uncharacterized membrane protein YhaH (DUF805 family)
MHYLIDPLRRHYFDFKGRATPKQYWLFILFVIQLGFIAGMIDATISYGFIGALNIGIVFSDPLISTPFTLLLLLPTLAITTRRLHDAGRTGWWQILLLIPMPGWFVLFLLLCLPSATDNQYGPAVSTDGHATAQGVSDPA